jgi:DNA-binding XRE family transcriptional regulator
MSTSPETLTISNPHWTANDWEHFRTLSLALQLEIERTRLSRLVKEARLELHLTRKQLSATAGVSVKEIRQLEKQKSDPTFVVQQRLCLVLGIETTYRLTRNPEGEASL